MVGESLESKPAPQDKEASSARIRITTTTRPKLWASLPVTRRNKRGLARKQAALRAAAPPPSQSLCEDGRIEDENGDEVTEKIRKEITPIAENSSLKRVTPVEPSIPASKSDAHIDQLPVIVSSDHDLVAKVKTSATQISLADKAAQQLSAFDIYDIPSDIASQHTHVNPLPLIDDRVLNSTSKIKTSAIQRTLANKAVQECAAVDIYDIPSDIDNPQPDLDSGETDPPPIIIAQLRQNTASTPVEVRQSDSGKMTKTRSKRTKTYSKKRADAESLARRVIQESPSEQYTHEASDCEDESSQIPVRSSKRKRVSKNADAKRSALKYLVSKRTSKKVPRRLPVNELHCVSERVEEPQSSSDVDSRTLFNNLHRLLC
jgi:hypothetical protein